MNDAYADASPFDGKCLLELGISRRICIPINGQNRRDGAKLHQNVRAPYVPRMKNHGNAPESGMHGRSHESVGVRDQSDDNAISFEGHASYIT
jgi:hypothetical protein